MVSSGIATANSICTGHGAFPPRGVSSGTSTGMTVNGVPVLLSGGVFVSHTDGSSSHTGVVTGSGSISINGVPVAKIGDPISCGSSVATGDSGVTM